MDLQEKCFDCSKSCAASASFLVGLGEEQQRRVMEKAVRKVYPKNSSLFREDDPVDAIYIIHSGRVKLSTIDSDGREQTVGIFYDREIIWEGIFIEESRYPYGALCMTDVDCCKVFRKDLEDAVQDPAIALRVIGLLSRKLHDANERVLLLSRNSPSARLAGFLLNRSRHTSSDTVVLRLGDIASSINLRPETVSRKIKDFERSGLIEKISQSGVRIVDSAGLQELYDEG